MLQNYPNPFNPSTVITFELPVRSDVTLTVFNTLGEAVAMLAEGVYEPGRHQVTFHAENLPSGVYLYRLSAGNTSMMGKCVLIR